MQKGKKSIVILILIIAIIIVFWIFADPPLIDKHVTDGNRYLQTNRYVESIRNRKWPRMLPNEQPAEMISYEFVYECNGLGDPIYYIAVSEQDNADGELSKELVNRYQANCPKEIPIENGYCIVSSECLSYMASFCNRSVIMDGCRYFIEFAIRNTDNYVLSIYEISICDQSVCSEKLLLVIQEIVSASGAQDKWGNLSQ